MTGSDGTARLDWEEALGAAILAAQGPVLSQRMTEADFGVYGEGAGARAGSCWWRLSFITQLSDSDEASKARPGDTQEARVTRVIRAWSVARECADDRKAARGA